MGNIFAQPVVSKSRRSRDLSLIDAFLNDRRVCFLPPPCQLNVQEYASFFHCNLFLKCLAVHRYNVPHRRLSVDGCNKIRRITPYAQRGATHHRDDQSWMVIAIRKAQDPRNGTLNKQRLTLINSRRYRFSMAVKRTNAASSYLAPKVRHHFLYASRVCWLYLRDGKHHSRKKRRIRTRIRIHPHRSAQLSHPCQAWRPPAFRILRRSCVLTNSLELWYLIFCSYRCSHRRYRNTRHLPQQEAHMDA